MPAQRLALPFIFWLLLWFTSSTGRRLCLPYFLPCSSTVLGTSMCSSPLGELAAAEQERESSAQGCLLVGRVEHSGLGRLSAGGPAAAWPASREWSHLSGEEEYLCEASGTYCQPTVKFVGHWDKAWSGLTTQGQFSRFSRQRCVGRRAHIARRREAGP